MAMLFLTISPSRSKKVKICVMKTNARQRQRRSRSTNCVRTYVSTSCGSSANAAAAATLAGRGQLPAEPLIELGDPASGWRRADRGRPAVSRRARKMMPQMAKIDIGRPGRQLHRSSSVACARSDQRDEGELVAEKRQEDGRDVAARLAAPCARRRRAECRPARARDSPAGSESRLCSSMRASSHLGEWRRIPGQLRAWAWP